MVKRKPLPWEKPDNLWLQHSEYSRLVGYEIARLEKDSPTVTKTKQILGLLPITIHVITLIVIALYEIHHGRRVIIRDIHLCLHIFGIVMFLLNNRIVYTRKDDLVEVIEWTEKLYTNFDRAEWCAEEKLNLYRTTFNMIHYLRKSVYFFVGGLGLGAMALTYATNQGVSPGWVYSTERIYGNWYWFEIMCIEQLITAYWVFRVVIIFVSNYIILSQHCSGQFRILSCAIRQLKDGSQSVEEKRDLLRKIQQFHEELLNNIGVVDSVFTVSLIMNKLQSVVLITFIGSLFLATEGEYMTKFSGSSCVVMFLVYPFFGQSIIDEADDFFVATYDCDWLELPIKDRKSLLLIMLMAEQPTGLTSGGLNYTNFMELTDVSSFV